MYIIYITPKGGVFKFDVKTSLILFQITIIYD